MWLIFFGLLRETWAFLMLPHTVSAQHQVVKKSCEHISVSCCLNEFPTYLTDGKIIMNLIDSPTVFLKVFQNLFFCPHKHSKQTKSQS